MVQPIAKLAESLAELISSKRRLKDIAIGGDQPLRQIFAYLKTRTGHDFAHYKRPTMLRRLKRRMQINHMEFIEDYYAFLRGNVEEVQALFADLLISVTTFFRDPAAFDTLAAQVVAPLISKERAEPVRVWVSGCATGEEAYSLAIVMLRRRPSSASGRKCRSLPAISIPARSPRRGRAGTRLRSKRT